MWNKDKEVWEFLEKGDFISLSETWVEEKDKENLEKKLSKNFVWKIIPARRTSKKGRAKGGFIIGLKKGWIEEKREETVEVLEGLVKTEISDGNKKTVIWSVYNSGDIEKYYEIWEKESEELESEVIIGGDFNIRIGLEGSLIGTYGNILEQEKRESKDKIANNGSSRLINFCGREGWSILNGNFAGDEMGEFTYIGARGSTVIDYVLVNENARKKVIKFQVEGRIESDHTPVSVVLEETTDRKEEEKTGKLEVAEAKVKQVYSWNEEAIEIFKSKTQDLEVVEEEEDTTEKRWMDTKQIIDEAVTKKEIKVRKWTLGIKRWWDRSCTKQKRKAKSAYRNWKKGIDCRSKYQEERREWRELCKSKEKECKEFEEEQLRLIKNENEVWAFLNRSRKKRVKVEGNIENKTWKEHFVSLLEGSETRKLGKSRQKCEEEDEKEKEKISAREIKEAWSFLKKRKAPGADGIPNEAWIHAGPGLVNKLICILGKVWDGQGLPEEWKMGSIVPLFKKGNPDETRNYRGITLMSTAYKLYTEVIRRRLVSEIEEKGILPDGQAGFRKGRATMDNIYILNHLIQRTKGRGHRLYTLFVDLKAAFDLVDRDTLWETMKRMGISKYIIERIKEIYEETKVRVRIGENLSEEFWTFKGLKQGCVLSPILFCIYIAEMEKMFKERNLGGVKIGNGRLWSLAYADDIVLLAENREALLDMMGTLRKFLNNINMILSEEKTKVLVFNRGRNSKKEKWTWGGKELEETQSFKYLGFTFNRDGSYKEHISELAKKGIVAAKKTWGLGEHKCKNDFKRRKMLYNYLVKSVMAYGCEIWGWEERKELEKIQLDYFRWVLKLEFSTPRYIIYREACIGKMKIEWAIRAVKFEEKISKVGEDRLIKMCWKEKLVEKATDKLKSTYNKERKQYYNNVGLSEIEVQNMIERNRNVHKETERRDRDIERQTIDMKIREAKYNRNYKEFSVVGLPKYLKKSGKKDDIEIIAKIRCGNFENGNKYWLREEEKICRLCKKDRETLKHFVNTCEHTRVIMKKLLESKNFEFSDIFNENGEKTVIETFKQLWKELQKIEREERKKKN